MVAETLQCPFLLGCLDFLVVSEQPLRRLKASVTVSVHCQLHSLESPEKSVSMRDVYTTLVFLREVLLITFIRTERHTSHCGL